MNTASYSLITMQPSLERLDVLCVGAAIISNGQWTICTLPDIKKIQSVDGGFKQSVLINTAASLEKLFSECADLVQARNLLANNRSAVRLHEFEGVFAYESDDEFQVQLSAIMAESVLPAEGAKDAPAKIRRVKPRIRTRLRQQFEHMGILGKTSDDINAHKVVPNYPVSVQHGLVAEFAIKNGVMSFTETLDFDVSDDGVRNRIFEAQAKCLVMKTAIETFGSNTGRHIVVAGASSSHAARSVDLLSTVGNLYALENSADMAAYFKAMERSASHIG
ncbi:hypothetical protein [uncultured Rhodoferax sp.]|uniref:hypothetical protein n=1 Tax=uncultured Rhodoferax sp. TaxID=223188 RepID=UPI0025DFBE2A|nr:hypothetical protein [uncultured Rhodoferax sp.]